MIFANPETKLRQLSISTSTRTCSSLDEHTYESEGSMVHKIIYPKTKQVPVYYLIRWQVNPILTRLFYAPKTKRGGGGGTIVAPGKNPVTLLRIHSSKVFLKACPKMNLVTQLWFPWKPWLAY